MKTLIFGHGYTGSRLVELIPDSISTELPEIAKDNCIPFDYTNLSTYKNLPEFDNAIITFKMTDTESAKKFFNFLSGKRIILLSSARNIESNVPSEEIDETSRIKDTQRAKAEKCFVGSATILYLGLIWGPQREPQKWLREGRIKNGKKLINMIHVDDLCQIIQLFNESNIKPGEYLVSDGHPLEWNSLAERYGVALPQKEPSLESRRFKTNKLISFLPGNFSFKSPIY